jgi:hypothetical protein
MTYAWPCLLSKNCVDPATRYHGHLLLSHIIAKFAIHKRIVLQAVLRIQIRFRIHMFLGLLDPGPDPLVRGMDPNPDLSIIKQKK